MEDYFGEPQKAGQLFSQTDGTNRSVEPVIMGTPVINVSSSELLGWSLGCVGFSLLVFTFATIQYLKKRWSSPKAKKKKRKNMIKRRHEREEKSIEQAYQQGTTPVEEFLKQLKKKKKKNWLDIEFKTVCKHSSELPCDIAKKPEHKLKNTYPTLLPYDHSRVILQGLPNTDQCSDYINASYIDGHNKTKAYIVAQGPNRHTIGDFWKMIWFENIHCIVMATNLFEHARQQCEKYWHNQHGRYGGIDVWLNDTDILADFVIRTFTIQKQGVEEERVIKQFQYNGWSDHDCPNPTAVLEYRRRICSFAKDKPGPLLVHCSKGAGRSGAFVMIDMALDIMDSDATVDVLNLLIYLRGFRAGLVRTMQQYEFIYDTISMYLQCGVTVTDIHELPSLILKASVKDQTTKLSGFEQQFKTLQAVVPKLSVGECAGGHRVENRRKSRDIMMQPPERSRPYLITHDSNESTDYINACYIDGYRHPNAYIVTQWPIKSTVNDVWRLVYDYNIGTVVVLNDMPFSRSYPRFWPTERNRLMPYGPLTVEFVEEEVSEYVTSRFFKVRKSNKYQDIGSHLADFTELMTLVSMQTMAGEVPEQAKMVRVFQLRSWANNQKSPTNPAYLIDLLTRVQEWQSTSLHGRIPTCVISKNGVSRVGMYCALTYCWEKLKSEGQIDVFSAVKTIKMNRPHLIDNLGDYMYLYRFFMMFAKMIDTPPKSNPATPASAVVKSGTRNSVPAENSSHSTRKPGPIQVINPYASPPTSFEYVDESPTHDKAAEHDSNYKKSDAKPLRQFEQDLNPVICVTNSGHANGHVVGDVQINNNVVRDSESYTDQTEDSSSSLSLAKTRSAPQLASLIKKAFSTQVDHDSFDGESSTTSVEPPTPMSQYVTPPEFIQHGGVRSKDKNYTNNNDKKGSCDNNSVVRKSSPRFSINKMCRLHEQHPRGVGNESRNKYAGGRSRTFDDKDYYTNESINLLPRPPIERCLDFGGRSPRLADTYQHGNRSFDHSTLYRDEKHKRDRCLTLTPGASPSVNRPRLADRSWYSADNDPAYVDISVNFMDRNRVCINRSSNSDVVNSTSTLESDLDSIDRPAHNSSIYLDSYSSALHDDNSRADNNHPHHLEIVNNTTHSKTTTAMPSPTNLSIPRLSVHSSRSSCHSETESYRTCSQGSSWSIEESSSTIAAQNAQHVKMLVKRFTDMCPTVPVRNNSVADPSSPNGVLQDSIIESPNENSVNDFFNNDDSVFIGCNTQPIHPRGNMDNSSECRQQNNVTHCKNNISNSNSTRSNYAQNFDTSLNLKRNNQNSKCDYSFDDNCETDVSIFTDSGRGSFHRDYCDMSMSNVPLVEIHSPSPSISIKSTNSTITKQNSPDSFTPKVSKSASNGLELSATKTGQADLVNVNNCSLIHSTVKDDLNKSNKREELNFGSDNKYITIDFSSPISNRTEYLNKEITSNNGLVSNEVPINNLISVENGNNKEIELLVQGSLLRTGLGVSEPTFIVQRSKSDTFLDCVAGHNNKCTCESNKDNDLNTSSNNNNDHGLQRVKSDSLISCFINLGLDIECGDC